MPEQISPVAAKALIHGQAECALLDIREHGQYGEGHPFLSVHCPYSDFEQCILRLVPNVDVAVILMDDGDGVAERAAGQAQGMGYRAVSVILGGAPAWLSAGFTLYKGVNLPSKTLGELVEHSHHPQLIQAQTLRAWQSEGRRFHFFDCRPPNEYAKMTVPGAACIPNGELAHRLAAVVDDETTPIVVTCAGRTRSLIGAAGLGLLGLPNPIYALENGTQGWALAGYDLQRGNGEPDMPGLNETQEGASRQRADALIATENLACVDRGGFLSLAADETRTLYLVDVRSAAEYASGHLAGAEHAWSGQIAQAADLTLGVRRARVVLTDDTGLRAALAAIWLRALGYEVFILRDTGAVDLPKDWRRRMPRLPQAEALAELSAEQVASEHGQGTIDFLDIRSSQDYRKSHVQGARWATRARLSKLAGSVGRNTHWVLLGRDLLLARYIAQDLAALGHRVRGVFAGSLHALREQGLAISASPEMPIDAECIDFLFFVHDRHDGNLESARRYLEWEMGLIAQLDIDEHASFRLKHSRL